MPRLGTPSKKKVDKSWDKKLDIVLGSIKEAGFRSVNDFVVAYYRSKHAGQSLKAQDGKVYGPGKIIEAWFENVGSDSRGVLKQEVIKNAATVLKEEIKKVSGNPNLVLRSDDKKLNVDYLTSGSFGLNKIHEVYLEGLPYMVDLLLDLLTDPNDYERWKKREKKGKYNDAHKPLTLIISQILFFRNSATNAFQVVMGLFLASSGASRRIVENLNHMSVSMSYMTTQRSLIHLTSRAVDQAREAVRSGRLSGTVFDNINFTLRPASQRLDSNTHQLNATTLAIFLLPESFSLSTSAFRYLA